MFYNAGFIMEELNKALEMNDHLKVWIFARGTLRVIEMHPEARSILNMP